MVTLATVALAPGRSLAATSDATSATWTQANGTANGCTNACPSSPPARAAFAQAYDQATGQLVLLGGQGNSDYLNDTWTWNGTVWTQVDDSTDPGCTTSCTSSPPDRATTAMAYDQATGQLLLFTGLNFDDETWSWNGTTLTQLFPGHEPAGKRGLQHGLRPGERAAGPLRRSGLRG